jgi:hypothetical protein
MSKISSFSLFVIVTSTLIAFTVFNTGYAQMSLPISNICPSGHAPVLDANGQPVIDPQTNSPVCKPVDAFGNVFGK